MNQVRLHGLLFSSDTKVLSVMNRILGGFSIDTEVCADYGPALDVVTRRGLDMLIVDWTPAHNPTRVIRAARGSSANANSTIVAMVNANSEVQAALLSGVNFIIYKPANVDHAMRCVKAAYGTMLQQRRRSARCPVDIPVTPVVAELGRIQGRITDISIGGLALQCEASLETGLTVAISFSLPATDHMICVTGKVVNADQNGRAGISFSRIPEEDLSTLVDWLAVELSKLENTELPSDDFVHTMETQSTSGVSEGCVANHTGP
jgi:PilZ domain